MKTKIVIAAVVVTQAMLCSLGFDMSLDTHKDAKWWKFRGDYIYAHSLPDGGRLAPQLKSNKSVPPTKGVWYFKNAPYTEDNDNYFEISYTLRHALFQQAWVRLLAHPSVVVRMKNNKNQEIDAVRSTGTNWCDAVFDTKLTSTVRVTVNLTEPGTYVMIDRIVLGVFVPIIKLNTENINPCFSNSTQHSLMEKATENYEELLVYNATSTTSPQI